MATSVGVLSYLLKLDTRQFTSGSVKTRQELRATNKAVAEQTKLWRGLRTAAVASMSGIVAGVVYAAKRQMNEMDKITKEARKLNVTTEQLARLQHVAEKTAGFGADQFGTALQRMARRIEQASLGTGEAVKVLDRLGININELSQLRPDAQFLKIADALKSSTTPLADAMALFDTEGVALVNTLKLGGDQIREMGQEADKLGKTFSALEGAEIEAANDAITDMKSAFIGLARVAARELAPAMAAVAKWLSGIISSTPAAKVRQGDIGAGSQTAGGILKDAFGYIPEAGHTGLFGTQSMADRELYNLQQRTNKQINDRERYMLEGLTGDARSRAQSLLRRGKTEDIATVNQMRADAQKMLQFQQAGGWGSVGQQAAGMGQALLGKGRQWLAATGAVAGGAARSVGNIPLALSTAGEVGGGFTGMMGPSASATQGSVEAFRTLFQTKVGTESPEVKSEKHLAKLASIAEKFWTRSTPEDVAMDKTEAADLG